MKSVTLPIRFYGALALACTSALVTDAQTSIECRVIPGPSGIQTAPPEAHIPLPSQVANQPAPVLPANSAEMNKKIAAAVEGVLAAYGNPTYAQVVTNDAAKAALLRAQLAKADQADALRTEVEFLSKQKDALSAEIAAKKKEIEYLQQQTSRLETEKLSEHSVPAKRRFGSFAATTQKGEVLQ